MELERLVYLICLKNGVNRKRRRFWYYWMGNVAWNHIDRKWQPKGKPKHISRNQAHVGYCKAKVEMKTFTPEIRRLCKSLNVKMRWNAGGMIESIVWDGKVQISYEEFYRYFDSYLIHEIVLR